jgi:hypothetical protein
VDERSSLAPGATWTTPISLAKETASVGFGGGVSADATRKQQVDFVFNVKKDFLENKAFREQHDRGLTPAHCYDEEGRVLIESDLRIQEWLDSALFARGISDNLDAGRPDVLTDDITFVVAYNASATPSWKLVRWSVNPNAPLASAARTRTNEALIAIGPAEKNEKGQPVGPSASVIEFRNIALIGSALTIANITLRNQQ